MQQLANFFEFLLLILEQISWLNIRAKQLKTYLVIELEITVTCFAENLPESWVIPLITKTAKNEIETITKATKQKVEIVTVKAKNGKFEYWNH